MLMSSQSRFEGWICKAFFLSLLVSACSHAAAQDAALWERLKKGGHIILMRNTAVDEGGGDPKGYKIPDCATQLNLTDKGRDEARRIGEVLRKRSIPVGQVLSSQFCRCQETAKLAFGKFEQWEALNSFLDKPDRKSEQTRLLHQKLGRIPQDTNIVIVTHGYNIVSAVGLNPDPGDFLIIAPSESTGGYRVLGELYPKREKL
jgi:Histidine phosphatase superfamily (branch 1)